ncbi:hypothetical protein HY085_03785 [Candidatus Gottesmanbacteria bacterium]|nr:hypothetical protein [Candidatus Gottesmanbacteria bacterium]
MNEEKNYLKQSVINAMNSNLSSTLIEPFRARARDTAVSVDILEAIIGEGIE